MDHQDLSAQALALFDRYAEMPHAQLSKALTELRQQDTDVCAELVRLLAADEQTHSFASPLQWFAAQRDSAQNDSTTGAQVIDRIWPDGTRLGPWCVDGIIGLGGMGVIYAAHRADGLYEREVALKTIRAEIMSPSLQQAFAKERSHLAKLEHPSIVALYDAGIVEDGIPWLAMARVHGDSIDRWCDANKKSLNDRVRLLIEACDAIVFAHAHGVLHQDIKPSNLLVTDDGKVKLLDFGLSAMLTQHGGSSFTRVGVSAAYAAPEVFEGAPPSVAIDVYALGVVLYRLLCADWPRTPRALMTMPNSSDDEAQSPSRLAIKASFETAQSRATRDASALSRALQGDLDAIARRCVNSDPIKRYASAADLRADLQSWLAHKPVAAREGGWVYRVSRFVRRNALAVAATLVLVSATAVGGVVALHQQERARLETENGEILSQMFEKSLGVATLTSLGSAPLSSQTLLEDVERQLRSAAGNGRPKFLARGLSAMARAWLVRADYAKAERLLTESKALGANDALQSARTNAVLAQMRNMRAKPGDAERLAIEGLAIVPQREGNDDELTRLDLELQRARARWLQSDPEGAITILNKAIGSATRLGKSAQPALAVALQQRGVVNAATGRVAEAEQDMRRALALLDDRNPAARNTVLNTLAILLASKGDLEGGHRLAAKSLMTSLRVFGPSHAETGLSWGTIAKTWQSCRSDRRRTMIALKQSEAILSEQIGPNNPLLESVTNMRTALAMEKNDLEEALKYARRTVDIVEAAYGANFQRTLVQKDNLARVLIALAERHTGAARAAYFRETDTLLAKIIIEGERQRLSVGPMRANYAATLIFFKRLDEAERQARMALEEATTQFGEDSIDAQDAAVGLMRVRVAQGRYDEAVELMAPMLRNLPPVKDDPYLNYQTQEMLLDIEIARGDAARIRAQYIKSRALAQRYGFMAVLNAKVIPGISPSANNQ